MPDIIRLSEACGFYFPCVTDACPVGLHPSEPTPKRISTIEEVEITLQKVTFQDGPVEDSITQQTGSERDSMPTKVASTVVPDLGCVGPSLCPGTVYGRDAQTRNWHVPLPAVQGRRPLPGCEALNGSLTFDAKDRPLVASLCGNPGPCGHETLSVQVSTTTEHQIHPHVGHPIPEREDDITAKEEFETQANLIDQTRSGSSHTTAAPPSGLSLWPSLEEICGVMYSGGVEEVTGHVPKHPGYERHLPLGLDQSMVREFCLSLQGKSSEELESKTALDWLREFEEESPRLPIPNYHRSHRNHHFYRQWLLSDWGA